MAHLVETMAYEQTEVPWHGLGVPVADNLTPDEMLVAAGLDWTVERRAQFINWKGEKKKTGKDVLVRSTDGEILTHISPGWNEVQNHQAAEFFNDFVGSDKSMRMNTAGSLNMGRKVWFLAEVKDSFVVAGKDQIDSYLLFTLPHEYGKCLDIRFTPIRVVCNNTLTLALNGSADLMVRLNHSKKFNPEFVKQTLGLAHGKMEEYKEMAEFLLKRKAQKDKIKEYFKAVFPTAAGSKRLEKDPDYMSKPARTAFDVLETQPGAEFGAGTWWQVYNSVTYSADHLLGRSQETRLDSAWYGPNRVRKLEALKKAVEFAEAS